MTSTTRRYIAIDAGTLTTDGEWPAHSVDWARE